MLTVLTTTHNRPEAFNLLTKWMAHQTAQPDQWVVVTDGSLDGYVFTDRHEVIVRERKEGDMHSVCENTLVALKAAKGDRIVICDDDDYFAPKFLETLVTALDEVALAGLSADVYYNVPARRFARMHNQEHASLTCTGFRKSLKKTVEACAKAGDPFIDMLLWERAVQKRLVPNGHTRPLHLGMKGSRTPNVGLGKSSHGWSSDRNFIHLKNFIGPDAFDYVKIARENLPW